MTISGPKRQEAQKALFAAFDDRAEIVRLLQSMDRDFTEFEVAASPLPENIARVVDSADASGWLLELLEKASASVPADDLLRRLHDELKPQVPPPGIDPFDVCRLSGNFLMLDRVRLRMSLRDLNQQDGKRILVVKGRKRAGKTHTAQFISYLSEALGQFSYVLIDLEAYARMLGPGVPLDPYPIATSLVRRLRYEIDVPEPPANGPWAHWIIDFLDNFEPQAMYDPAYRWIVIDAFNSVVATQSTLDLVKELCIRISRALPRFRLVLLGFDAALPGDIEPHLDREEIAPIWIDEVTEFFANAFAQQQLPIDVEEIAGAVARVLAGLDPQREDYLTELTPRVLDELAKVNSP